MNAALTVALRDLRERRNMLLLSVALTLVPFLAAALPAARSDRPAAIGIGSLILAVGFGFGTAIALGSSVVSGDLAQRRISFYFARPLSSAAIWFGKTLGALLASFLGFLVIILPALILSERAWGGMSISRWAFVGTCMAGILIFFLVSHMVSTSIRSRSPLIVADLVLALVTIFAIYHLIRPVLLGGGVRIVGVLAAVMGVAMVGILAAAPVWQLASGRADIRRNHAALSKVVWTAIVVLLLIAGGYVAWLTSTSPFELETVGQIMQSPGGTEATVEGSAKRRGDYRSAFVVNLERGGFSRQKSPLWWGEEWSRNGKVFAWFEATQFPPRNRFELFTRNLGSREVTETGMTVNFPAGFVLSEDGSRVAIAEGNKVAIYDLRDKRLLAAVTIPSHAIGSVRGMFFVTPDVVRIFERNRSDRTSMQLHILEFSVATRTLTQTGQLTTDLGYAPLAASKDGSRLLLRRRARIVDGRTGQEIAALPPSENVLRTTMLGDGRVVAVDAKEGGSRLQVYSPDGVPSGEIALPGIDNAWLTGETGDGKLLVLATRKIVGEKSHRTMLVVDLRSGAIEKRVEGLRGPLPQWSLDPRLTQYAAAAAFLAIEDDGNLVTWSSATGERKSLAR